MNSYFNKIIKNNKLILTTSLALTIAVFCVTYYNQRINKQTGCPTAENVPPVRIASTSLASDELLARILKEAGQPDRLVAVSTLADNPAYSHLAGTLDATRARIGDNLESIAALKPDLVVFANFNRPAITSALGRMATRTCWLENFSSLADIHRNTLMLGDAIGLPGPARVIADHFIADIRAAEQATNILIAQGRDPDEAKRPRVLSFDGSGTVMAAGTTFDDLVALSGGINAATAAGMTGWPRITAEAVAGMAPEVIVLLTDTRTKEDLVGSLEVTPGWRDTPAVKNRRYVAPRPADLLALSPEVLSVIPSMRAAFLTGGGT